VRLNTAPREWLEAVLEVALERLNLDPNIMSTDPGTAALEVASPKTYQASSGRQPRYQQEDGLFPLDAPYAIPTPDGGPT
jgi:hypothetical protein